MEAIQTGNISPPPKGYFANQHRAPSEDMYACHVTAAPSELDSSGDNGRLTPRRKSTKHLNRLLLPSTNAISGGSEMREMLAFCDEAGVQVRFADWNNFFGADPFGERC
jgi:hypothetical protein